jgi:hypothetical protein
MLVRLTPRRFLWASLNAPPFPLLAHHSSWHNRQSGWLSLRSLRLPFLWIIILHSVPSQIKLKRINCPLS